MFSFENIRRYFFEFTLFAIFTFSSMDIVLNVNLFGFNFRLAFLLLVILVGVLGVLKLRDLVSLKFFFPLYLVMLTGFVILNLLFVPNSVLISRGLFHALTLVLYTVFLVLIANYQVNIQRIILLYIISFVVNSVWGILQLWMFYNFGIQLFMAQPGRINGFTYEPSYFVTYLTPGLVLSLFYMLGKIFTSNGSKTTSMFLYSLPFSLTLGVTLFSTSKLIFVSLVLLIGALVFLILIIIVSGLGKRLKSNFKLSPFVKNLLISTLTTVVVFATIPAGMNISKIVSLVTGVSYSGIDYSQVTEKLYKSEQIENTSLNPRLEGMKYMLKIFSESPIIGRSLGGIAAYSFLKNEGFPPRNNEDAKRYESANVFLEILAGTGIFGFLLFMSFIVVLSVESLKKFIALFNSGQVFQGMILIGLLLGFLIQLALLAINQNILRIYVWLHVAVLILFLTQKNILGSEQEYSRLEVNSRRENNMS